MGPTKFACWLAVAGCGFPPPSTLSDGPTPDGQNAGRTAVAWIPATLLRDVDIVFMIDDAPGMIPMQSAFASALPTFVSVLDGVPQGLPNVHIGVVSTDMGSTGI